MALHLADGEIETKPASFCGRSDALTTAWPLPAAMNMIRSASSRLSSSKTTPPSSNCLIFLPVYERMPVSSNMRSIMPTAFSPMRMPGLGMGAKKASEKCLRIFRFFSMWCTLNRNSKAGPPRTPLGSLGLPPKPTAIVPLPLATSSSRRSFTRTLSCGAPQMERTFSLPLCGILCAPTATTR